MSKRETPIKRPSCYRCKRGIEDYEDYIVYGGTDALGKELKIEGFVTFNFHMECFKENVEEAKNQKPMLVELAEGKYVFLEWVGKTWSYARAYSGTLTVEDVEKFLQEIPKNQVKEWRRGGK